MGPDAVRELILKINTRVHSVKFYIDIFIMTVEFVLDK